MRTSGILPRLGEKPTTEDASGNTSVTDDSHGHGRALSHSFPSAGKKRIQTIEMGLQTQKNDQNSSYSADHEDAHNRTTPPERILQ